MHASTQIRLDFDRHRVHSPGQVAAEMLAVARRHGAQADDQSVVVVRFGPDASAGAGA